MAGRKPATTKAALSRRKKTVAGLPVDPVDKYVAELKKAGETSVPCPYGMGTYNIKLEGSQWYGTPQVEWVSNAKCPDSYASDSPNYPRVWRTSKGRVIPWYPKWRGKNYHYLHTAQRLNAAEMVIGIILSGRKLYTIKCGQRITSWDQAEGGSRDYYNYE